MGNSVDALVFYSGHGGCDESNSKSPLNIVHREVGDYTNIEGKMKKWGKKAKVKVMGFMDCCRVPLTLKGGDGKMVNNSEDNEPQLTIVYASKHGEPAFAVPSDGGLSKMTKHLLDFIESKSKAGQLINFPTDYIIHNTYLREYGAFEMYCDKDFEFIPDIGKYSGSGGGHTKEKSSS